MLSVPGGPWPITMLSLMNAAFTCILSDFPAFKGNKVEFVTSIMYNHISQFIFYQYQSISSEKSRASIGREFYILYPVIVTFVLFSFWI